MSVHRNSFSSYHTVNRDFRIKTVLDVYKNRYPKKLIDQEVVDIIGKDQNWAKPWITHLIKEGILLESGEQRMNPKTGKMVRQCSFNKEGIVRVKPQQVTMFKDEL